MSVIDELPVGDIPDWPLIRIELHYDPRTDQPLLTVAGEPIDVPEGADPHRLGINATAAEARTLGRPVRAIASEGTDDWPLIVYPDGATADPDAAPLRRTPRDHTPRWRLPAGLGLGIAGLVVLIGVATSLMLITPTARSTALAPSTAPFTSTAPTVHRPATLPRGLPSTTPSTSTLSTAAPPDAPTPTDTPTALSPTTAEPGEPTIEFTTGPTPSARREPTVTTHPQRPPRRTRRPALATDQPAPVTITEKALPTQVSVPAPPPQPAITLTPQPRAYPQVTEQPQPSTPANNDTPPPANTAPLATGLVPLAHGYCLADRSSIVGAMPCSGGEQSQIWTNWEGTIQHNGLCLDHPVATSISLDSCIGSADQIWTRLGTGQLHNQQSGTCLGIAATNDGVVVITDGRCTT